MGVSVCIVLWVSQTACILDVGLSDCTGCGIVRLYWMWDCQTVLDVGLSDCTGCGGFVTNCGCVRLYWVVGMSDSDHSSAR